MIHLDIAVVEDEKAIREHIMSLIENQEPASHPEGFATGEELLAAKRRFDIVFLDIQMEGLNGIETARILREKQEETILVFVTGIREYVFEALDLYAASHYHRHSGERHPGNAL